MSQTHYTWEQAPDGTYSVRGVPVFELGEHRGFRYDEEWARKALRNFSRLKREREYLPPVILGRTRTDTEEKPAVGFMDRLRLVGKRIVADLTGLGADVFAQIRAGHWPYRSIEVFDRAAQITALALLGGTPPHMKTAPLHFAEDGDAGIWIHGEGLPRLSCAASHTTEGGHMSDTATGPATRFTEEDVARLVEEARREEREKFAQTEAALRTAKEQIAALRAEERENRAKAFRAQLGEAGYAPAITGLPALTALTSHLLEAEPVRFHECDTEPLALLADVLRSVADRATAGTAFVDTGERAHGPVHRTVFGMNDGDAEDAARFDGVVDPASLERYRAARELSRMEGISFRDALTRVVSG